MDDAMMNTIKIIVIAEYTKHLFKNGIDKDINLGKSFIWEKGGKELMNILEKSIGYDFSEKHPKYMPTGLHDVYLSGIRKSFQLMENLHIIKGKYKSVNICNGCKINLDGILKVFSKDLEIKNNEITIAYAIIAFLNRFIGDLGETNTNEWAAAYKNWNRFVYNLVGTADVKSAQLACAVMVYFDSILDTIALPATEQGVLEAIEISKTDYSFISNQLKEEAYKAKLMRNENWRKAILAAEDYYLDGHIMFLLDLADRESNKPDEMEQYLAFSKMIFDGKKKPIVNSTLFERAILCVDCDPSIVNKRHLLKVNAETEERRFSYGDYSYILSADAKYNIEEKEAYNLLLDFLAEIKKSVSSNIENYLTDYVSQKLEQVTDWRKPFLVNNLFGTNLGGLSTFSNCIYIDYTSDDYSKPRLLMFTRKEKWSRCVDIETYLLYKELKEKNLNVDLVLSYSYEYYDESKIFPLRYVLFNGRKIGLINGKYFEQVGDNTSLLGNFKQTLDKLSGNNVTKTE